MKYTPKQLATNHNISHTHPLKELSWLLGGLALLVSLAFLILSWAADWLIERTSVESEVQLLSHFNSQMKMESHPGLQLRLDALLAELPDTSPLKSYSFEVFLIEDDKTINAVALPGGTILVYSGLLNKMASENELAMVLSHELGHFRHRDHLRGLGRGLSLALLSALLFGDQSGVTEFISAAFLTAQANYSREQEARADEFALDLLAKRYGHAGGATDFFKKMAEENQSQHDFLSTHPALLKRVKAIENMIVRRGLPVLPVKALTL